MLKWLALYISCAVGVAARTNAIVPLYVSPNLDDWTAAVNAATAHPDITFYVVINPNDGPRNTSSPTGSNPCYVPALPSCPNPIEHGCNADWTRGVSQLNNLNNVRTIGYVWSRYGNQGPRPDGRPIDDIKGDIAEYAAWNHSCTWGVPDGVNISIYGIWFDETATGASASNLTEYADLANYTRQVFAASGKPDVTIVFNPGSMLDNRDVTFPNGTVTNYETAMFSVADAVITRETCFTNDPSTSLDPDGLNGALIQDCPGVPGIGYYPYNYADLKPGNGTPAHTELNSKAVVLVHQFHPPPAPGDLGELDRQVRGTVALGLHSIYFTTRSWHHTTIGPATIANFSNILAQANGVA